MHLRTYFLIAYEVKVRSDNSQVAFRRHIDKCVEQVHSNNHFFRFYNFLMHCVNADNVRKVAFSCSDFTFLDLIYVLINVCRSEELISQHITRQRDTLHVMFCVTQIHDFHSFNFTHQQIHHVFNVQDLP